MKTLPPRYYFYSLMATHYKKRKLCCRTRYFLFIFCLPQCILPDFSSLASLPFLSCQRTKIFYRSFVLFRPQIPDNVGDGGGDSPGYDKPPALPPPPESGQRAQELHSLHHVRVWNDRSAQDCRAEAGGEEKHCNAFNDTRIWTKKKRAPIFSRRTVRC